MSDVLGPVLMGTLFFPMLFTILCALTWLIAYIFDFD